MVGPASGIWAEPLEVADPRFPKVYVPAIAIGDVFDDLFTPLARDEAGNVEVGLSLQKALLSLAMESVRFGPSAERHSDEASIRSAAVMIDVDLARIKAAAEAIRNRLREDQDLPVAGQRP